MTQLNYLEELKSIRLCLQKPHYKVGVFTHNMKEAELAYSDFMDALLEDNEQNSIKGYISTMLRSQITFKNGSIIKFVLASENARGYKFNHVLYDKDISREIFFNVVTHAEFPYKEQADGR